MKISLSRDELREFLIEVILTPAGKVNKQSRRCQSCKVTPEVREETLRLARGGH